MTLFSHRKTIYLTFWLGLWVGGFTWLHNPSVSQAHSVQLHTQISHPVLGLRASKTVYLKVSLKGLLQKKNQRRTPVNLAVVLDRSTSMSGLKLQKALAAAKMVVRMLKKDDIFSLITYDSKVEVLIPATKMTASTRKHAIQKINQIHCRGMTALFGGVSKGIAEVRKFLNPKRVNRVILLSDGQANVGPSTPKALGRLGIASAKQGISISTIGLGLGYNEDLMTILALKSDGNHGFARRAGDLEKMFQSELGNVLSVVAQRIRVKIQFPENIKPIRILENRFQIHRQHISFQWNQIYSNQKKFIIVEVKVPAQSQIKTLALADVHIQYTNMKTHASNTLFKRTKIRYIQKTRLAKQKVKRKLMIYVSESIGNEVAQRAIYLRDKGKLKLAQRMLMGNAAYLRRMAKRLKSKKLKRFYKENLSNSKAIKSRRKWNFTRKKMKRSIYKRNTQQTW